MSGEEMNDEVTDDENRQQMRAMIMGVIENQLRDQDPPETKETYDRLIADGHSDQEARNLIGTALSSEIVEISTHKKDHSQERYIQWLRKLPTLPWE